MESLSTRQCMEMISGRLTMTRSENSGESPTISFATVSARAVWNSGRSAAAANNCTRWGVLIRDPAQARNPLECPVQADNWLVVVAAETRDPVVVLSQLLT